MTMGEDTALDMHLRISDMIDSFTKLPCALKVGRSRHKQALLSWARSLHPAALLVLF